MKKIVLTVLSIILCLSAGEKEKIQTKKYKIADIPEKEPAVPAGAGAGMGGMM